MLNVVASMSSLLRSEFRDLSKVFEDFAKALKAHSVKRLH